MLELERELSLTLGTDSCVEDVEADQRLEDSEDLELVDEDADANERSDGAPEEVEVETGELRL